MYQIRLPFGAYKLEEIRLPGVVEQEIDLQLDRLEATSAIITSNRHMFGWYGSEADMPKMTHSYARKFRSLYGHDPLVVSKESGKLMIKKPVNRTMTI